MKVINEVVKNRYLYILAVPGIVFLILFAYLPMTGHLIAFKEYNFMQGILGSPWVGFKNFRFFFTGNDWFRVTLNTIYLNFLFILFGTISALILAISLNEIRQVHLKKISQSFIFLPYFISWMVVSMMVFALLNTDEGLVNKLLTNLGFERVMWFSRPNLWPFILTMVSIWKNAGYSSIIYMSALTGISDEYYESTKIDGANWFQQIWYITLPLIRTTVIILVLLNVGRIFYGDFGMIYGIIGDNSTLYSTTDVIDTYSYRALRQLGNFSAASCVSLYQSTMGFITIITANWVVKKIDNTSKLF